MISIRQAAQEVGRPYSWVRYIVATRGLGQKIGGWAIVLSELDLEIIRKESDERKAAA